MTSKTPEKLVALVTRGLKNWSAEDAAGLLELLPAPVPADAPARRRALLAMRIALLRRAQGARPVPAPAAPEPEIELPAPEPEPEPEAIVAPPLAPRRPPRTLITSIRLEDAAQLLAAAAEPDPLPSLPPKGPQVPTGAGTLPNVETVPEPAPGFAGDAEFWNSDFDTSQPQADLAPVAEAGAAQTSPDGPQSEPQDLPPLADTAPATVVKKPRKRKKAGATPTSMDAADAAAAMNALFMMGDDDAAETT